MVMITMFVPGAANAGVGIHALLDVYKRQDIVCKALNGGPLSNRKSINVPGIKLNLKFRCV